MKELLDISSNARINPEDKKQKRDNDEFNNFLDTHCHKKFEWQYIDRKLNLSQLITETKKLD